MLSQELCGLNNSVEIFGGKNIICISLKRQFLCVKKFDMPNSNFAIINFEEHLGNAASDLEDFVPGVEFPA